MNKKYICLIGLGYVGLPLAVAFAEKFKVVGFDISQSRINELKDGDSTIVGEKGIKISGGQRQRISIARALYNDSQLIIFDEPTSALDSKTQEDLINSLIELKGQKTIVLISHIKSFMEKCDEIYEISNSKIKRINE